MSGPCDPCSPARESRAVTADSQAPPCHPFMGVDLASGVVISGVCACPYEARNRALKADLTKALGDNTDLIAYARRLQADRDACHAHIGELERRPSSRAISVAVKGATYTVESIPTLLEQLEKCGEDVRVKRAEIVRLGQVISDAAEVLER